ncbi:sensor histidine kinase [Nonomuraea ceibae]|uniref:sensor histidine kinase n=1 Tax=Nonomuraea ceibae TaxID=1935170 RepID=UPI0027DECC6E|nr:ATP-binding protein [Nonomuraea ceibae]
MRPRRIRPLGRLSVRARMTLLYGGIFTVITLGALVVAQRLQGDAVGRNLQDVAVRRKADGPCEPGSPCLPPPGVETFVRADELEQELVDSQRVITLVTFVAIALLAFAVCWWLTGRLLRPLHRITATARRLSLSTLHERIALTGPQDELKELADTFDAMLDRLERAVAGQRRFVANASHELRTPLAIQRTAVEVGLADPSPERLAWIRAELLRNTERSERLIDGLLVLAQGERGLDAPAPVDLAAVVEQVVAEQSPAARDKDVTVAVSVTGGPVVVAGDEVMLTRLVANLVENAVRHNHRGGRVLVELSPAAGLIVGNTGPLVPPGRAGELFEPFRRLDPDRTGSAGGAGLGLSIVAAITAAHGGRVEAVPNPDGGLRVTVALPPST